jgi:hypothetical protein
MEEKTWSGRYGKDRRRGTPDRTLMAPNLSERDAGDEHLARSSQFLTVALPVSYPRSISKP